MSRRSIPCSTRWSDKAIARHNNRIDTARGAVEKQVGGKYEPPKKVSND